MGQEEGEGARRVDLEEKGGGRGGSRSGDVECHVWERGIFRRL